MQISHIFWPFELLPDLHSISESSAEKQKVQYILSDFDSRLTQQFDGLFGQTL